jgi:glycerophosphoryl diester phosphodiesterase
VPPLIIGHRGAPAYRPEHTLASYELALSQGAAAVEPDLVSTKDGVLVLRHEHDISATTDVAAHPEFAARRRLGPVAGALVEGWFTEDFTWDELATLRARERIPALRPANAAYDDQLGLLRFEDLLSLVAAHNRRAPASVVVVAEIKDDAYFRTLGIDIPALAVDALAGFPDVSVVWESFEKQALLRVRAAGHPGQLVYLVEREGVPADEAGRDDALTYPEEVDDAHIHDLTERYAFDGISPDVRMLLRRGKSRFGTSKGLVERAHGQGLDVFTWTLRPESSFLPRRFRQENPARVGRWQPWYQAVLDLGIEGIFTDSPDLLAGLVRDSAGVGRPA